MNAAAWDDLCLVVASVSDPPAVHRQPKPTPDASTVAELYVSGLSESAIAKKLGVPMSAVRSARQRAGVPIRKRGKPSPLEPSEIERLLARAKDGERYTVLAHDFGVTAGWVSKTCLANGIRRLIMPPIMKKRKKRAPVAAVEGL